MNRNLALILLVCITALSCKTPEARKPVSVNSGSLIDASIARNKALYQKETKVIETIIASQPEHQYQTSGNGFWYHFNTKIDNDSLAKPAFGDLVKFNYDIKDLNGTTIYTKEELKTQNYAMDQQELFSGLREGLKLMHAGETATFIFPSQKAYGYYGDENKIGTNIPIICEVSVLSVTQKE
ncbi:MULTISPECIES: gliding motility-associated peptidyl-prolyl isomerase GldI [unclassified Olleya]|uniref:gliding motility-associated peptidyl-prolyl isomerase GldI n=1 Tax=unclassified Olleya TaxID=2615019 RepID=UPI000C3171BD|nr:MULTISPECIES: gliding motility-associated peptidyl-prolyl isomerase GldI [unclassified Olleya]AUC77302.1 gliding motility-associated peptidyl-prolyl isomerase GldI [Olleya sp. Bg11-27]QXP59688.1 gliding motility-associated peptidyl-prolyl isomerase GldI [Olleya sp. HaHaR_3_96]